MALFLYSNCVGSYVFDSGFNMIDRVEYKDALKASAILEKGELTEEESTLITKHSKDKGKDMLFIGFKSGIGCSQNIEDLERISRVLDKDLGRIYKAHMLMTKIEVRNSVKNDNLILQTINNIEDLNRATNTLVKRLREWYELYNPEFSRAVSDHEKFVELILQKDKKDLLKEINMEVEQSMGAELSKDDLAPVFELARKIDELYKLRESHKRYLEKIMVETCPNLTELAGALIGAKLIEISGDLRRLSMFPSSTVQLLGAEKALFRHITKGAKSPKFGVIFQHPLVARANKENKGKAARALANKLNLAVKKDVYGDKKAGTGKRMLEELEAKFR